MRISIKKHTQRERAFTTIKVRDAAAAAAVCECVTFSFFFFSKKQNKILKRNFTNTVRNLMKHIKCYLIITTTNLKKNYSLSLPLSPSSFLVCCCSTKTKNLKNFWRKIYAAIIRDK